MDINIYDLKLREIDRQISAAQSGNPSYTDLWGKLVVCSGKGMDSRCNSLIDSHNKKLRDLQNKRAAIVKEMEAEQQYLKDQYMLQQAEATEFARQQALKAAEEVRAAANKTEQELQIANQKLAQANEALAKQQAAESLAKSVDTGNLEAGRILMGINTVSKYKTPLIIGAITITVLALGFVGYKMLAKAKKV